MWTSGPSCQGRVGQPASLGEEDAADREDRETGQKGNSPASLPRSAPLPAGPCRSAARRGGGVGAGRSAPAAVPFAARRGVGAAPAGPGGGREAAPVLRPGRGAAAPGRPSAASGPRTEPVRESCCSAGTTRQPRFLTSRSGTRYFCR